MQTNCLLPVIYFPDVQFAGCQPDTSTMTDTSFATNDGNDRHDSFTCGPEGPLLLYSSLACRIWNLVSLSMSQ